MDQSLDFFILDPVDYRQVFFLDSQDAGLAEDSQVFGDIGLLLVDGRGDLTDASFPLFKQVQYLQTGGLARL